MARSRRAPQKRSSSKRPPARTTFVEAAADDTVANLRKIDHVVVLMLENRSFDHMLGYLTLEGARTGRRRPEGEHGEQLQGQALQGPAPPADGADEGRGPMPRRRLHRRADLEQHGRLRRQLREESSEGQARRRRDGVLQRQRPPRLRPPGARVLRLRSLVLVRAWCDLAEPAVRGRRPGRREQGPEEGPDLRRALVRPAPRDATRSRGVGTRTTSARSASATASSASASWTSSRTSTAAASSRRGTSSTTRRTGSCRRSRGSTRISSTSRSSGRRDRTTTTRPPTSRRARSSSSRCTARSSRARTGRRRCSSSRTTSMAGSSTTCTPPAAEDDKPSFRTYGVRVPALVVSPFTPRASVSNVLYDHTSIIKTILLRFCAKNGQIPDMGARVTHANHLGGTLTLPSARPPTPEQAFRDALDRISAWRTDVFRSRMLMEPLTETGRSKRPERSPAGVPGGKASAAKARTAGRTTLGAARPLIGGGSTPEPRDTLTSSPPRSLAGRRSSRRSAPRPRRTRPCSHSRKPG